MAKKKAIGYKDLLLMAEEYGVESNTLFLAAAQNYEIQRKLIDRMHSTIENDDTIVSKEYVKDRENLQAHPLVKELPKHIDSANRSLSTMLEIVTKLGAKKSAGDKLNAFLRDA